MWGYRKRTKNIINNAKRWKGIHVMENRKTEQGKGDLESVGGVVEDETVTWWSRPT